MGDFERTFGAGADADAIIRGFSAQEEWEFDDDDYREPEILQDGKGLPKAKSFFDLTGQIWHPAEDPRARIGRERLKQIDQLAREAVMSFNEIYHEEANFGKEGDYPPKEVMFLEAVRSGLDKTASCLDEFEVFFCNVVRDVDVPLLFVRDAGPNAGYVSPTLSTHVFVFEGDRFLARFGGFDLDGPFGASLFVSGSRSGEATSSFCAFSQEGPGRKALAMSAGLRGDLSPERAMKEWIEESQPFVGIEEGIANGYDVIAQAAHEREPRTRIWTDRAEDALRRRVRSLGVLLPEGETLSVSLHTDEPQPSLTGALSLKTMTSGTRDEPLSDILSNLLSRIDVSAFRGAAPEIKLLDDITFSAHQRLSALPDFLDLMDELGLDRSAIAKALSEKNVSGILEAVSAEKYDHARRREAAYEPPGAALVRHGLSADDLPY